LRKLHLVGLTTDRDGLIFTARKGSKSGGYIVPLDKKVLAAIAAAGDGSNGDPSDTPAPKSEVDVVPKRLRSESALTPREMQARLRAGRTIDEVAAEAGVDTEWVARFAVPILAEQAQVVELARSLVYAKPRLGESSEPLGSSVLQNLSDRGVFLPDDVLNNGWSAFQLHDSVWMVRFRYRSRGRDQEAQWEIDVPAGRLRARNRQASDLGYVGPDRWAAEGETDEPSAEAPALAAPARRRAAPAAKRAPRAARPARKAATAAKAPQPTARRAPASPAKKSGTRATKRTPAPPAKARPAKTVKSAKTAAARNAKAAPAGKKATPRKAGAATRKAASKTTARPAPAKTASRRRATKAVPAPEAGPAAGSGGVRMAVARVSTARVAASLAAADREPWAAAVRRASRSDAGPAARAVESGPTAKQASPRDRRFDLKETVGPFQPRPLPKPGSEPPEPRVRKVTVPAPRVPRGDGAGPAALTLPAPRRPAKENEVLAAGDRSKRRRLRSR
jgi:hypothetical protein